MILNIGAENHRELMSTSTHHWLGSNIIYRKKLCPNVWLAATQISISCVEYGAMENWLWSPSETGQCQKDYKHSTMLFPFNPGVGIIWQIIISGTRGIKSLFLISYISKDTRSRQDPIQFSVIFHAPRREKLPNSIHRKHTDVAQIFSSQYLKICSNVI